VTAQALILTGGIYHPFEESAPALAKLLGEVGVEAEITFDIEAGLAQARAFPLIVLYALRWGMTQNEKYAPFRAEWAFQLSDEARSALWLHVMGGGGLLCLHTASICFDGWEDFSETAGAQWRWGVSHHPPLGPVSTQVINAAPPLMTGVADFTSTDEVYHNLTVRADMVPLLRSTAAEGEPQITAWAASNGDRLVHDSLGHDAAALQVPSHARFLQNAALWCLGGN
jgi:uncharacterized protein